MNLARKIFFPLLMAVLLITAFVLPKYVQNTKSPAEQGDEVSTEASVLAEQLDLDPLALLDEIEKSDPSDSGEGSSTSTEMLSFVTTLQAGDFDGAESVLAQLKGSVGEETYQSLKTNLQTAQKKEAILASSQEAVGSLKSENETIRKSVEELAAASESAVAKLASANETAEKLAVEASALRKELDELKKSPPASDTTTNAAASRLPKSEIPETESLGFGANSSVLTSEHQNILNDVVLKLKNEERLTVQLRGYADSTGSAEYNAIIALARSETVKDHLTEAGIEDDRISVLSFGESQATADSDEPPRRVEVRFGQR